VDVDFGPVNGLCTLFYDLALISPMSRRLCLKIAQQLLYPFKKIWDNSKEVPPDVALPSLITAAGFMVTG
jgi:hypothetical protein